MPPTSRRSRPSPRRFVLGVSCLLAVLALLLGACSSDDIDSSTTTTDASGDTTTTVVNTTTLDEVTIEGAFGEKPTVTFDTSYAGDADSSKVLLTGDGAAVESGQLVSFDYVQISGADGSELSSSYGGATQSVTAGSQSLIPIVTTAFVGTPIGSRVIVATNQGSKDQSWTLFVFDIQAAQTIPTSASGDPVPPDPGLPAVTVGADGVPAIAAPQGAAPTDLVVQPLIKGNGPAVTAGQTLVVNYVGVVWDTGTVFDSSYTRGQTFTVPIGAGQVISGWDEGLVGQTVGSRVLLVVPPDKGYGAQGSSDGSIKGTDTLVFVVDILAAS